MKRIVMIAFVLMLAGMGCRKVANDTSTSQSAQGNTPAAAETPSREEPVARFFSVHAGDRVKVGDLVLEVHEITSLTAQGCEGGPTGCPDSIAMTVSIPGGNQSIQLVVLGGSRPSASSERLVFGHHIILSSVERDSATIGVFVAQNPTTAPAPSGSGPSANPPSSGY